MHGAENVGYHQSTGASFGIKLDVSAIGGGTDTVEGNSTLSGGIDALDGNSNNAPLILGEIGQISVRRSGTRSRCWRAMMRGLCGACACGREVHEVVRDAQVRTQDHVDRSIVLAA